jgi:hypothetical protein
MERLSMPVSVLDSQVIKQRCFNCRYSTFICKWPRLAAFKHVNKYTVNLIE